MTASQHTQISVSGTSQTLNAAVVAAGATLPAQCRFVWVQPNDGAVYFRDDGTAPTGTQGFLIKSQDAFPYSGDFSRIQIIAATTGGATKVNLFFIGDA